ncbi:MAG: glutathione S-transferase [Alphaproteobacteria bacterium]|nr:MAG: glutathione S-transferase [Alphaproteobacteria bacterium]
MLQITALYAGILALIMVFLAYKTSARRREAKISLGTGDDAIMEKRSRAFGNFIEFVPMMILLMAIIEIQEHRPVIIHIFGIATVAGRLFHAMGMTGVLKAVNGRFVGAILTYLSLLLAGAFLLYNSIMHML